ncbi:VOC family protein [Dietzia sp. PP-33]|jgi:predicted 3-demethylubiquinone-9 3-methyltransferase (glyoxalase superfamily)|uniref:VOC family protein n=1 Tax=Dietzia sp. PP-33 TaxID=2957500 RepID=UPI0029A14F4B|nr:VOC family protein [Dietzia sp. PP-33]MDX2355801.1 VOC family protein [Dietzia sp. PP-33]
MAQMTTCLWFDRKAEEAAEFYCSVFPRSRIISVDRTPIDTPGPKTGEVVVVEFELDGRLFVGLDGGPGVEYTDAVSLEIRCADQAEIDHYWDGLLAGGGREVQCGWLIDRYGVRWQVAPTFLYDVWRSDDRQAAVRAFTAMMDMVRLDLAALEAAARGD